MSPRQEAIALVEHLRHNYDLAIADLFDDPDFPDITDDPDFPDITTEECPYCGKTGGKISDGGALWHSQCLEDYDDEQHKATGITFNDSTS